MNPLGQAESAAPSRGPSLFRYSPALVLIAIAVADAGRLADPDLWWHVRVGQAILAQGHLLSHNLYSYSAPNHPFIDFEWLCEALMAWMYNGFGILGLKLLKFVLTALTVVFLALAMGDTGAPTLVQFGVLIASAIAILPQMQFRPQLFTFAFLSALLVILAHENRKRTALLWLAVPMLALWANLHGGVVMGLAALGTFSAVVLVRDLATGRGLSHSYRLVGVTVASTLATLLTPYGLNLWRTVLRGIGQSYSYKVITGWQPLAQAIVGQLNTRPGGVVYIAIALLLFATLALSLGLAPTTDDVPLVAFAALAIVSTFLAIRNLPIAVIATATPLAGHLGHAVADRRKRKGLPEDPMQERSRLANQLIVTVVAVVLCAGTGLFSNRLKAGDHYPVGAVRFMREHHLHGKILNRYAWGGYLIWHLEPGSRVFIDGRYNFAYPMTLFGKYLRFHFAYPGGARLLKEYPPDFVLISPTAPSFKLMESRTDWELIYRDGDSALFARKGSAATRIPGVPVRLAAAPASFFP